MSACPHCGLPPDPLPMIWVPGKPVTWGLGKSPAGPRVSPPDMKAWQKALWAGWHSQPRTPLAGPVSLVFRFRGLSARADLTNMVKAAEDGLKTHAFGDDSLVYRLIAEKTPATSPEDQGLSFHVAPFTGHSFACHVGRGLGAGTSPKRSRDVRRTRGRPVPETALEAP